MSRDFIIRKLLPSVLVICVVFCLVVVFAPVLYPVLVPPDLSAQANSFTPATLPVQPTVTAVAAPSKIVQLCLDSPPLYPVSLFRQAVNTLADWINADTTLGKGGFVVYTDYIVSQSYNVEAYPPITVPAIPENEPQPALIPAYVPKPGDSPYAVSDKQTAIDAQNASNLQAWQVREKNLAAYLSRVQAQVKRQTDSLRLLTPPYDARGADYLGCLQMALQHFSSTTQNVLIIASALVNNTLVNKTSGLRLYGHVRAIFTYCPTAPACDEREHALKATLLSAGASPDIEFFDPQASLVLSPQF